MSVVQWSAVLGSIAVLVWSVPGLILNPDFRTGDAATAVRVLGSDMNGWHAVSGFALAIPGLIAARRRVWAARFVVAAAVTLVVTGLWAMIDTRPAWGLFYFPGNVADAVLHFATSTIFVAGAVHHHFLAARTESL